MSVWSKTSDNCITNLNSNVIYFTIALSPEKRSAPESNRDSIRRANSHVIVNVISMNLPIEGHPPSTPLYKRSDRSTVIIRKIYIHSSETMWSLLPLQTRSYWILKNQYAGYFKAAKLKNQISRVPNLNSNGKGESQIFGNPLKLKTDKPE